MKASSATVFYFHSIGDDPLSVSPIVFRRQMQWLRRAGYECPTVAEWLEGVAAPRIALITFDDGFDGVRTHAAPILAECGFRATLFVPTDYPGTRLWGDPSTRKWVASPTPNAIAHSIMTWDSVGRLSESGWEIGAHGVTHRNLTDLSDVEAESEVQAPRTIFQRRLGIVPSTFCYPRGRYNDRLKASVAAAGYAVAFSTARGRISIDTDRYALPRVPGPPRYHALCREVADDFGPVARLAFSGSAYLERFSHGCREAMRSRSAA